MRAENSRVVSDLDVLGKTGNVVVDVGVVSTGRSARRNIVALNGNILESDVKVARVLNVSGVPVDCTTSPVDCALGVGGKSTRPQRDLDEGRGLGEGVGVGGGVVSVVLLEDTADLAVD